ncbi:MAG: hypothetical protein PHI71_01550 [Acidiphilium sp.]|nr:hypothetical protein [Acidiphilium sp.]
MWNIVAVILAIGIAGGLALTQEQGAEATASSAAISAAETQAAQQMNIFATAAYNYASTNSLSAGTTVTAATLLAKKALPAGFEAENVFGQALVGMVTGSSISGQIGMIDYYGNAPTTLLGLPLGVVQVEDGVATKIAQDLSAMQENAPAFIAAVANQNGGTSGYSSALLPFGQTAIGLSTYAPKFTTSFPSLLDLADILPSTGVAVAVAAGSGGSATNKSSCTGGVQVLSYTGAPQAIKVPQGCTSMGVVAVGGDGAPTSPPNASYDYTPGYSGSSVTETVPVTPGQTLTAMVGVGGTVSSVPNYVTEYSFTTGTYYTWVNGYVEVATGGIASELCSGTTCPAIPASNTLVEAGGGGISGDPGTAPAGQYNGQTNGKSGNSFASSPLSNITIDGPGGMSGNKGSPGSITLIFQ